MSAADPSPSFKAKHFDKRGLPLPFPLVNGRFVIPGLSAPDAPAPSTPAPSEPANDGQPEGMSLAPGATASTASTGSVVVAVPETKPVGAKVPASVGEGPSLDKDSESIPEMSVLVGDDADGSAAREAPEATPPLDTGSEESSKLGPDPDPLETLRAKVLASLKPKKAPTMPEANGSAEKRAPVPVSAASKPGGPLQPNGNGITKKKRKKANKGANKVANAGVTKGTNTNSNRANVVPKPIPTLEQTQSFSSGKRDKPTQAASYTLQSTAWTASDPSAPAYGWQEGGTAYGEIFADPYQNAYAAPPVPPPSEPAWGQPYFPEPTYYPGSYSAAYPEPSVDYSSHLAPVWSTNAPGGGSVRAYGTAAPAWIPPPPCYPAPQQTLMVENNEKRAAGEFEDGEISE